jgi:hypothetical protein
MRNLLFVVLLTLGVSTVATAQSSVTIGEQKTVSKPSRDHFLIQLSNDRWTNVPDSVQLRNGGRGVGLYLMYDFPIKNSNFSFGAGLGYRFSNIYLKRQSMELDSRTDKVVFTAADSAIKGNKYVSHFLEVPLELRYFANKENRNRGFKFAIGAKIGYTGLGGAYYKEKASISGKYIGHVTKTNRFSQNWRLAPSARIGWGNFSVFAEYTVTPIFKTGMAPEVRPFAAGIVISGL